jgi:RNA polymerase sigma-70 factor, ECF subfamily
MRLMSNPDQIAAFEAQRNHLRGVAYRMLGSLSEADDAVQEAWLRLNRSDANNIQNLGGWLTTVVARVCLDMLRSRKSRHEESLEDQTPDMINAATGAPNPEQEALLADSVGLALLVVLETLTPSERLAFVLHDMFELSFEEIAAILGRSPEAARQLASRARRRVRGTETVPEADLSSQREVVDAFLAALRAGDFEGLIAVLHPDVLVRIDAAAAAPGAPTEIRGARNWAQGAIAFSRLAQFVEPALVNGAAGLVFAPRGRLSRALSFKIEGGKILEVEIITDPERLRQLNLTALEVGRNGG